MADTKYTVLDLRSLALSIVKTQRDKVSGLLRTAHQDRKSTRLNSSHRP